MVSHFLYIYYTFEVLLCQYLKKSKKVTKESSESGSGHSLNPHDYLDI